MRKMERIKRFKNTALNQAAIIFDEDRSDSVKTSAGPSLELDKMKELSSMRIE